MLDLRKNNHYVLFQQINNNIKVEQFCDYKQQFKCFKISSFFCFVILMNFRADFDHRLDDQVDHGVLVSCNRSVHPVNLVQGVRLDSEKKSLQLQKYFYKFLAKP